MLSPWSYLCVQPLLVEEAAWVIKPQEQPVQGTVCAASTQNTVGTCYQPGNHSTSFGMHTHQGPHNTTLPWGDGAHPSNCWECHTQALLWLASPAYVTCVHIPVHAERLSESNLAAL
jgi:hypothetical protein